MKWTVEHTIILLGVVHLILQKTINPLSIVSLAALIYSYSWAVKLRRKSQALPPMFWGFFIGSNAFMFYINISWFFDIGGAATGSSTSALIFLVMPVYAFICGGLLGLVFKYAKNS